MRQIGVVSSDGKTILEKTWQRGDAITLKSVIEYLLDISEIYPIIIHFNRCDPFWLMDAFERFNLMDKFIEKAITFVDALPMFMSVFRLGGIPYNLAHLTAALTPWSPHIGNAHNTASDAHMPRDVTVEV